MFPIGEHLGISDAAEAIGFRTMGAKVSLEKMAEKDLTPFINTIY